MSQDALFDRARSFFDADDWPYTEFPEDGIISSRFSGKNGDYACFARIRSEQGQVVFYTMLSVNVPPEKRATAAEYLTRVNYGMIIGNFEMDYVDGEVRYKTSLDVSGATLTNELMQHIVYANVLTMDRYAGGMMRVIYGDVAPATAVDEIEDAPPEDDDEPDDAV